MSVLTQFNQIGLDETEVRNLLTNLGIDVDAAGFTTSQLESLGFVADRVMRTGISNKAEEIERELLKYDIDTSKLSALQSVLTTMKQSVDAAEATAEDLMAFIEKEEVFIDNVDMTKLEINYSNTPPAGNYSGTIGVTYETLQDYVTALEANAVGNTVGSWLTVFASEYETAYHTGVLTGDFVDANGTPFWSNTTLAYRTGEVFAGRAYIKIPDSHLAADTTEFKGVYITGEGLRKYFVARVLQQAGYIDDDVYLNPIIFASATDQPASASPSAAQIIYEAQVYFGSIVPEYDTTEKTLSVSYNGTAALSEMGINLSEYSKVVGTSRLSALFDPAQSDNWFYVVVTTKGAYLSNVPNNAWSDTKGWVLTKGQRDGTEVFTSDNIDILMEATATGIQSQSTKTEVALLRVNTAITEWGELNDGWDMFHQYIHDALKRATDNGV